MRKKVIIILIIVVVIAAAAVGGYFALSGGASGTETLESIDGGDDTEDTDDRKEVDGIVVVDVGEAYSEEEQQQFINDMQALCDKVFSIILNFDSDTADYTDTVTVMYGTDENLFTGNNSGDVENIYKEFQYMNLQSEYTGFTMDNIKIWDDGYPSLSVLGRAEVTASLDGVEEGSYCFPLNLVATRVDGELLLYNIDMQGMYETDGLTAEFVEGSGNSTIAYQGTKVFTWYFDDYDLFLSSSGSESGTKIETDRSTDPDDYDEVINIDED